MGLNLIEVLGLFFLHITFSIREMQTHTDTYTCAHTRRVSSSSVVVLLVRISSNLSPFSISVSVLFVVLAGCPFFMKLSSADPTWKHAKPERSQLNSWKSVVCRSALGAYVEVPAGLGQQVACIRHDFQKVLKQAFFTRFSLTSHCLMWPGAFLRFWFLTHVHQIFQFEFTNVSKGQVFLECSLE